jgi:flagellum-specific peptidoglycan hydrolase FlgJ
VIESLDSYATDPKYTGKVKDVVNSLLEDYPLLFNP